MNYQKDIFKKYKEFIINKNNENFNCSSKKFKLQNHQKFLNKYIIETNNLLVYHLTGSGKTCVGIQIAEALKKDFIIYIILPKSLITNFEFELNNDCGNYKNKNNNYNILSINSFLNKLKDNSFIIKTKNKNILLLIDEAHNIISETGKSYNLLKKFLYNNNTNILKLVLMTASPIVDNPSELLLLFNLFIINEQKKELDLKHFNNYFFNKVNNKLLNKNVFSNMFGKYISFYKGAPENLYPKFKLNIIKIKLSSKQQEYYNEANKLIKLNITKSNIKNKNVLLEKFPPNFYIGLRTISNIILINNNIDYNNINIHSSKFIEIYKNIKLTNGKVFIYSSFRWSYGIESFSNFLKFNKWKYYFDCSKEELKNDNILKFAIWSGEESIIQKELIKNIFNNKNNIYGQKLKVILGSPSSKEGISFKCVKQVHIIEPYWNYSRIYQIYSRAIRYCSHIDLPPNERFVSVYLYIGVVNNSLTLTKNDNDKLKQKNLSIDEYIYEIILKKKKINNEFENQLKESAFDKLLFDY